MVALPEYQSTAKQAYEEYMQINQSNQIVAYRDPPLAISGANCSQSKRAGQVPILTRFLSGIACHSERFDYTIAGGAGQGKF